MKKGIPLLIAGMFLSIPAVYGEWGDIYQVEGEGCKSNVVDCWDICGTRRAIYCSTDDCPKGDIEEAVCYGRWDISHCYRVDCWAKYKEGSPHRKCHIVDWCFEGGGGGGCPFLYALCEGDTGGYVNSLLPASETYLDEEVTDYYAFSLPLEEAFGGREYHFDLDETDQKHSWFDQVRLIAVDHPEGSYVGVTYDGKILAWIDSLPAIFCVDQNGNDHLSEIIAEDGLYFEGNFDDTLIVGFGNVREKPGWEDAEPGARICVPPGPLPDIKTIAYADQPDYTKNQQRINGWKRVGEFYERTKKYHPLVDLSSYTIGELIIRLTFGGPMRIDHIHLIKPDSSLMIIQECPLSTATSHCTTDITDKLLHDDSTFAELFPNEVGWGIDFYIPQNSCPSGYKRSFVFISNGRYETYKSIGTPSEERVIPSGFAISLIRPTPFSSWTDIHYSLSKRVPVSLSVYDISGRLITTLEDGVKEPGRYSVLWDGTDDKGARLPQGTYFVKLKAGGYTQTRKLVIVR